MQLDAAARKEVVYTLVKRLNESYVFPDVAAKMEQAAWMQRVSGLRDAGLDADTLDERSRAMLNLAEPNELVVPYGKNKLY